MSKRNGYYLMIDGDLAGPFTTVSEAKDASRQIRGEDIAIRTVITVERQDETGKWVTVH
jgi:hypothetical protein